MSMVWWIPTPGREQQLPRLFEGFHRHRPSRGAQGFQDADLADIRLNYGSSSTIVTEYLLEASLAIPKTMATALYLGLKTDTQNLGRHATHVDYNAAIALYPKVQLKILSQIENPDLSRDYFLDFDRGLHEARFTEKPSFATWEAWPTRTWSPSWPIFSSASPKSPGASSSAPVTPPSSSLCAPREPSRTPVKWPGAWSKDWERRAARKDGRGADPHPGHLPGKSGQDASSHSKRFLKYVGQEDAEGEKLLSDFPFRNGVT